MNIRTRLFLLLAGLLAAFGVAAGLLQRAHRLEAESILANLREERSELLDRLLELTGQPLASFASDYSLWDEMVAFTQSADPSWAAINIEASLPNFSAQAAWVVQPDGTLLYSVERTDAQKIGPPPLDDPAFLDLLRSRGALHYFQESSAGLVEVRTGPILPSDDTKREQTARGWFLVARVWNDKLLTHLGDTMGSAVSFAPAGGGPPSSINLARPLPDWHGQPTRTLHVSYQSVAVHRLLEGNKDETLLLYLFGILGITAVVFSVSKWVVQPLRQLDACLSTGGAQPILSLRNQQDEFGQLARQLTKSFEQRDALRITEENLRQAVELQGRLARDLHDGIIQSIYATGIGLEIAQKQLVTDPDAALKRLHACQKTLNDTLWQVRQYIDDLEPESVADQTPIQSLTTLAATMQSLQSIPIVSEIDPHLAARITPPQEMHLLKITRELLSNAFRHSGASQVKLSLKSLPDGRIELAVSDDGRGFDAASYSGKGRGLANLAIRARELDAELLIDAAPGNGSRIFLRFYPVT